MNNAPLDSDIPFCLSAHPLASAQDGDGASISLDLTFHARHGVLPQEQSVGGEFRVRLRLSLSEADAADALCSDSLDGTVNYAEVYELVRKEMERPSALIEHVAARICKVLLHTFSKLREVETAVTKVAPPITGFDGRGVTVSRRLRRRLVAWDFDGTIADTSRGIVRTMTAAFERMHLPVPSAEAVCRTIGLPLTQSIAQLSGMQGARLDEAVACYKELFEEVGTEGVTLFDGVREEMEREHRLGLFVGIATSRGHESVCQLCRLLGISEYVDFVVACEDVTVHKPQPEHVWQLCRLAHVLPEDTTVVGDTTFDIEMGRRAGAAKLVGVGWGNHPAEMLRGAGAHIVVERF